MKLENKSVEIQQVGMLEVAEATIKASAKTFDMFENSTYFNKPVAIVRELVANGIDAHIMAGTPNRPVEVFAPTEENPYMVIRDFGIGMSHEFVMNDFMAYSNGSTKSDSDDVIGGWGIGSKSPFSYVDQFSLRVVYEGVVSNYVMFKNERGLPAIGRQSFAPTTEHNGVEVSFPVQVGDIDAFQSATSEALKYFDPMPIVHDAVVNRPDYSYRGTNWGLLPQAAPLGIIMGGIRYPVLDSAVSADLRNDANLSPLLGYGIDVYVPMGQVLPSMSREGLSYNEKTNAGLRAALNSVVGDVVKTFSTIFDNEPTLWEAKARLFKETGGVNAHSRNPRQKLLAANAVYKGKSLTTEITVQGFKDVVFWRIEPDSAWTTKTYKSTKNGKWLSPVDARSVQPGNIGEVIIDDLPDSPKSKTIKKIDFYLQGQGAARNKQVLILRTPTRDGYDQVLDNLGNPLKVTKTSDLPEPPKVSKAATANAPAVRPHVRMFTWDGTRQDNGDPYTNITPGGQKGVKEIKYADQPDHGIMVVTTSFDLPKDFDQDMKTGLVKYDELHFVNVGDWNKLQSNPKWRTFQSVFKERLAAKLKKHPELPVLAASTHVDATIARQLSFIRNALRDGRVQTYQGAPNWPKENPNYGNTPLGGLETRLATAQDARLQNFYPYVKEDKNEVTKIKSLQAALTEEVKTGLRLAVQNFYSFNAANYRMVKKLA